MYSNLKLLYFSATGTTAKVVKAIAKELGDVTAEYDITLPSDRVDDIKFVEDDLLIIGVPVYAGRVPDFLVEYFNKISGDNTKAIFIVVYGNRDYDDALLELLDIFKEKSFVGIAGGAFIGEHSYTALVANNRPDIIDLNIAASFGKTCKEKLDSENDFLNLKVKGNYPYKERLPKSEFAPITNANCNQCGLCAELCPSEAIDFIDAKIVDSSKCIKCCRCIKKCPVQAKEFNHPIIENIRAKLITNFSKVRKEPEFFI